MSRLFCILVMAIGLLSGGTQATAQKVLPAEADVSVSRDRVKIVLQFAVEPVLAGLDVEGLDRLGAATDEGAYDVLRAMPAAALRDRFEARWPAIREGFRLLSGGEPRLLVLQHLEVPPVGDPAHPRISTLTLTAALLPDRTPVTFGWDASFGTLAIRQLRPGGETCVGVLTSGEDSAPMPRTRERSHDDSLLTRVKTRVDSILR